VNPFPIYPEGAAERAAERAIDAAPSLGPTPRITSLLIKPASAVCNLDCSYCFYLDREADP
jgi:sulfatase maturation enzyme AslB (radical SAM superfamily)